MFSRAVHALWISFPLGVGLSFIGVATHNPWWYAGYAPEAVALVIVIKQCFSKFAYAVWTGADYPYGSLVHCYPTPGDAQRKLRRLERQGQRAYIRYEP